MVIPMFENRAAYTATAEAATGVVIDEDQQEMLLPLEANLVFSKAGVRMMTGLKGNIYWPKHSAVTVNWEGENVAAKDGSGKFEKRAVFAPKRLTAYVDMSKQLLIQENRSVEARIRQLAAIAFAQKIEQTAFSKAAHADNVPDGMFQETPTAVTGAMSWENIVKMEEKADLQNALFGDLAYVMHPSLVAKAKTKVKDASGAGGFIFQGNGDGLLNGFKALRTNNMRCSVLSVALHGHKVLGVAKINGAAHGKLDVRLTGILVNGHVTTCQRKERHKHQYYMFNATNHYCSISLISVFRTLLPMRYVKLIPRRVGPK
jgi:HK97 family phage major capsid protein